MNAAGAWLQRHGDLDRLDRELLLCRGAGLTRVQVLSRPETTLSEDVLARLDDWAERRRRGEPLAYITGSREFWGLTLTVTPDVLVPRPDTELLVEAGLERLAPQGAGGKASRAVLELGTGSGAVSVALALECAQRRWEMAVTATDVSAAALAVAADNARRLGATVAFVQSDWFAQVPGPFHMIISNPPYIADGDPHLPALAHEPQLALRAGPDGLDALSAIAGGAWPCLEAGGWLILEHGFDQGPAVRELLLGAGFEDVSTRRDLAGHERVTEGRRPEAVS